MKVWEPQRVTIGGRLVRPYTMTGGRSGMDMPEVALEALVSATPLGVKMRHRFRWEAGEIVSQSRTQVAVIELAALLDVPLGVVRVLVCDLRKKGAIIVTDPPEGADGDVHTYTDLLTKVLDGIKSL